MYSHETQYRVRYADTDQMGFMYYGNYSKLYEIGRVEAFRNLGFSYKVMEDGGVMMPVYENKSRYILPAYYDELLTIKTFIKSIPSARAVYSYEIYDSKMNLIHTGETTLVFLKKDNNRLVVAPKELRDCLLPYFE
jgi:acyl-CoA thioester hydrolase